MGGGVLSNHQRLRARVEVTIDGSDLASRLGDGYLVLHPDFERRLLLLNLCASK